MRRRCNHTAALCWWAQKKKNNNNNSRREGQQDILIDIAVPGDTRVKEKEQEKWISTRILHENSREALKSEC